MSSWLSGVIETVVGKHGAVDVDVVHTWLRLLFDTPVFFSMFSRGDLGSLVPFRISLYGSSSLRSHPDGVGPVADEECPVFGGDSVDIVAVTCLLSRV